MRFVFVAAGAAILLAGCQSAGPKNSESPAGEMNATENAVAGDNTIDRVLAMSDKERNGVLNRAVMDATMPCDGVLKSERWRDVENSPTWLAHCRNGTSHLVVFQPGGNAKVMSPQSR